VTRQSREDDTEGLEATGPADGLGCVLERHPDEAVAQPGYVWLELPGKVQHVPERDLEFTESHDS
jgi:hypothetical protein